MLDTLVLVLDLCGTFVFALSGAAAGIKGRLDIFGVLVLAFVAANSGGIIRDLLIGAVPPPGIADWRYIAVPVLAGLATFYADGIIDRLKDSVQIFDAAVPVRSARRYLCRCGARRRRGCRSRRARSVAGRRDHDHWSDRLFRAQVFGDSAQLAAAKGRRIARVRSIPR